MQILVILAFALVGFTLNFGWDLTVRRRAAAKLAACRREARPRALPPAPDPHERARRLPDPALRRFVDHTRACFVELDALINQFDLLLLRSRDRARFGVVTIRSEQPRAQAQALLGGWLAAWADVDDDTRERLAGLSLGPELAAGVLARERQRTSWEFRRDSADVLYETITDLDRAVIHMQEIVRTLEAADEDPYR
jgi:hypothetical protein